MMLPLNTLGIRSKQAVMLMALLMGAPLSLQTTDTVLLDEHSSVQMDQLAVNDRVKSAWTARCKILLGQQSKDHLLSAGSMSDQQADDEMLQECKRLLQGQQHELVFDICTEEQEQEDSDHMEKQKRCRSRAKVTDHVDQEETIDLAIDEQMVKGMTTVRTDSFGAKIPKALREMARNAWRLLPYPKDLPLTVGEWTMFALLLALTVTILYTS